MIKRILLSIFIAIASVSLFAAQTTRRQTTANDFKVRYRTTMGSGGGQAMSGESVTMIKGARERSENHSGYGFDMVQITQCDLKRTIQLSDATKKYTITPIETGEPTAPATSSGPAPAPTTPGRQGGVVEYVSSVIDTGERKEMFGFTARHVKSSTSINAGPDSCHPGSHKYELDGWYIDLNVEFSCEISRMQTIPTTRPSRPGCHDQVKMRHEGNGKLGYPLVETVKTYGENGQVMMTQTKEVIELSRASLDVALFDIPAGYTEATNTSELYGTPSVGSIAGMMNQGQASGQASSTMPSTTTAAVKRPGSILIGVVQFNNKAGRPVSLDALRQRLIGQLGANGADAVPLNASSQMEAEAEAKVKQCDFILYTDVAALKQNKLGGMFGNIAGVPGAAKTEAKLEFKLFAVGEPSPRLQSSASAKLEGDENSAGSAVDAEARTVANAVKKKP